MDLKGKAYHYKEEGKEEYGIILGLKEEGVWNVLVEGKVDYKCFWPIQIEQLKERGECVWRSIDEDIVQTLTLIC